MMPSLGPNWMDPAWLLERFGSQFFWISSAIIFVECGLFFPILPGDSLLFAVGLFIANGALHLNLVTACVVLSLAAFAGNVVGYEIGRAVGAPLYEREGRFVNRQNFDRTHVFFAKYGAKALVLLINSPGGSVTAGMAIYDTMMLIEPDVATTAMGLAASMGQFLLTAGAPGKSAALPHARILMHQPSAGVGGTAADIAIQADMLGQSKREMAELISQHTGQPVDRIIADSDRDRWFTAQEALEYGFIDRVVSRASEAPSDTAETATEK